MRSFGYLAPKCTVEKLSDLESCHVSYRLKPNITAIFLKENTVFDVLLKTPLFVRRQKDTEKCKNKKIGKSGVGEKAVRWPKMEIKTFLKKVIFARSYPTSH